MRRLTLLLLALAAAPASAHDYWLQPATFSPAVNKPVAVELHVGDHLDSEGARPFDAKATLSLRLVGAKSTTDLTKSARDGDKPFARVSCPAAGTHVVALERDSRLITLEAKKFNAYLTEEGLTAVLAARKKDGASDTPGRERHWRSLKCILQAGGKSDATWKKALGHKLEIMPLADPASLRPGDKLTARVLLFGKPLAGAQVQALTRQAGKVVTLTGRTSDKGEVTFALQHDGMYLLRLVHMRRAAKDKDADWESFWGALTFAVRKGE